MRPFAVKRWIINHVTASILLAIAMAGVGAAGIHSWLTVEEAAKKFNIGDPTLQVVIQAYYKDNHKYPEYFWQLTTPLAYINGSWNPEWGHERVMSDEEVKQYAARPKWERDPFVGKENDLTLWTSLTPKEQEDWIRWRVDANLRPHLIHERFSPEQKMRILHIGDQYYAELRAVTLELISQKATEDRFERERLDVYSRCVSNPLEAVFCEVRLDRPLLPIQAAIRSYREKHGSNPQSMSEIKGWLECNVEVNTPGFIERWGSERPLLPIELDTPTKWDKAPWDQLDISRWDWHSFTQYEEKYGEKELYNGFIYDWVDSYFQRYLPYYPFTPEQKQRILEIRNETFEEMESTLRSLVSMKASRWAFEDMQANIWDKATSSFYEVFESNVAARKAAMHNAPASPPPPNFPTPPVEMNPDAGANSLQPDVAGAQPAP